MNSAHAGVLHDASNAVTATQNRLDTVKNTPSRSAHRRLRISLARGSAAALSFSDTTSDHSAAVSTPRWTSVRHASGRPARVFTVLSYESYCDSGFSGVACWLVAGVAGALAAVPPVGSWSPRMEARICSSRECPAICTLAC